MTEPPGPNQDPFALLEKKFEKAHNLLMTEIPLEQKRLQAQAAPTLVGLRNELAGTLLECVRDVGVTICDALRLGNHITEQRLAEIEAEVFGEGGTRITVSDAEDLMTYIEGSNAVVKALLADGGRNPAETAEGRAKLEEHLAFGERMKKLVEDNAIEEDDDELDGEDGDGDKDPKGE